MDAAQISSGIVEHSRQARLSGTSPELWRKRLETLIAAQPEVSGPIRVQDVKPVAEAAGGSNGTLLFRASYRADGQLVEKAFVLRFLPTSGLFHHYDVKEQFDLQRSLESTSVPVASQVWLDEKGKYLERPGYVMERVEGTSSPMAWMTSGIIHDASPSDRRKMSLAYLSALADIHAVDWKALGLDWLEERATGTRPIERETNWYWDALVWSKNAEYIRMFEPIRNWLIANEPDDMEIVLCHGDANYGNYLFKGSTVTAVLDWEMSFLGTRECDVAFMYIGDQILLDGVPVPEGCLSYEERKAEYEQMTGHKLQHLAYFELFVAYRLGIINVLAMNHFPPEVLESFGPVMRRGPAICRARAEALGVELN